MFESSPSRLVAVLLFVLLHPSFAVAAEQDSRAKQPDATVAAAIEALRKGETNAALNLAQQALAAKPGNVEAQFTLARVFDELRDFTNAIAGYTRVIELQPSGYDMLQWRGMANFKAGRVTESVGDFEAYLEKSPQRRAHHWQLGISLYYVGRFHDGRKLFELHRTVNPDDVENAAWHFLCNARAHGIGRAREELIPIAGDGRVPMREIFKLFAGTGTEAEVFAASDAGKETLRDAAWRNQRCYAHLYVGLYHEARGDVARAKPHIEKASTEYFQPHYMGDVARVHWMRMQKPDSPAKK